MTHVFKHPKYYEELRKESLKLPGPRPISNANKGLIHRQQASSLKLKGTSCPDDKSPSAQAPAHKRPSLPPKAQASSQSPQAPGSEHQGTSVPSPYPGNKQQG